MIMMYISPTIEFTEDDWTTKYTGAIIQESFYSFLIISDTYGTFWIPKQNTKVVSEGYWYKD